MEIRGEFRHKHIIRKHKEKEGLKAELQKMREERAQKLMYEIAGDKPVSDYTTEEFEKLAIGRDKIDDEIDAILDRED